MGILRATSKKEAKAEVRTAYHNRIDQMAEHGEDSPEGLLAEATADTLSDEYTDTYGDRYSD